MAEEYQNVVEKLNEERPVFTSQEDLILREEDAEFLAYLKEQFSLVHDDASNKGIVESLLSVRRKSAQIANEDVRYLVENMEKLSKLYPEFKIGTWDDGTMFWGPMKTIGMSIKEIPMGTAYLIPIFWHEVGHAANYMLGNLVDANAPQVGEAIGLIKRVKNTFQMTPEISSILAQSQEQLQTAAYKDAIQWYAEYREPEAQRITAIVEELYASGKTAELRDELVRYLEYDNVKIMLDELGVSASDIEGILQDKNALLQIMIRGNNIINQVTYSDILRTDYRKYGGSRKISAMLNSLLQDDSPIKLADGSDYVFHYSHSNDYWSRKPDNSYKELIADYFSLSAAGQTETLEKIKVILGPEIVQMLEDEIARFADNLRSR